MEIIFTGTGSSRASIDRFHSSILITTRFTQVLVDAGDGVAYSLLKQKIKPEHIDCIILSHTHSDHCSGLASLLTQMKIEKRTAPLKIITGELLIKQLKNMLKLNYVFEDRLGFEVLFTGLKNNNRFVVDEQLSFIFTQNTHLEKYAACEDENLNLVSGSMLFYAGNKKILYTADIGGKSDLYLFTEKPDWLISEISHIEESDLKEYIENVKPQKVYLTHIDDESLASGRMKGLTGNKYVVFTYDGLKITL